MKRKCFLRFKNQAQVAVTCLLLLLSTLTPMGTTQAATFSWSASAPTVGADDIASWDHATADALNVNTGGNYGTMVANNQPAVGQSFTTGSNVNGYEITAVTMRHVLYDTDLTDYDMGPGFGTSTSHELKIGTVDFLTPDVDSVFTSLTEEFAADFSGSTFSNGIFNDTGTGTYITINLDSPITLNPNTEYGFQWYSLGAAFFETDGLDAGTYGGGRAFAVDDVSGVAGNIAAEYAAADHGFQVHLTAATNPASFWNVDADGNWNTPSNWTNGVPPVGSDAIFGNLITADRTVTLDVSPSVNSVTFNNALNTGDYFIVPDTNETLTLTGDAEVSVTAGRHWLRAEVAGTAGLNTTGGGELILDADNSFSGGVVIDNTAVAVTNADAIPAGNDITIQNSGSLGYFGSDNGFFGATHSTGLDPNTQHTISDDIEISDSGSFLSFDGGADVAISGAISGDGNVTTGSGAKLTLSGATSYAGVTHLYDDSTLTLTGSATLGDDPLFNFTKTNLSQTSQLALDGVNISLFENFFMDGAADGDRAKIASSGTSSIGGNINAWNFGGEFIEFTSAAGGTLTLDGTISADDAAGNNRTFIFSGDGDTVISSTGSISDAAVDSDGFVLSSSTGDNVSVVKRGSGTLTLTPAAIDTNNANNFWQANTTIEAGTLEVLSDGSNNGELQSSTIAVQGGTLDVDHFSFYSIQSGQDLSGAGNINVNTTGALGIFGDSLLSPGNSVGTLTLRGTNGVGDGDLYVGSDYFDATGPRGGLDFELASATTVGSGVNDLITGIKNLSFDVTQYDDSFTPLGTDSPIEVLVTLTDGLLAGGGAGTYTLVQYSGSLTEIANTSVTFDVQIQGVDGPIRQNLAIDLGTSGEVQLDVTGAAGNLVWTGTDGTNPTYWDVNTTANWTGDDTVFLNLDNVTFNDSGATSTVDMQQNITAGSVTFDSSTSNTYTINGTGFGLNASSVALTGDVTASLANDTTNSVGDVSIGGSATLEVAQTGGATNVNGDITGSGTLAVNGAAAVLNGDNSGFTGDITVTNASLVPTTATALGGGTVTANSNGTIGFFGQTYTNNTPITLNGGFITVGGGAASAVTLAGDITLTADSNIQQDQGTFADGATVNNVLVGSNTLNTNVDFNSTLNVGGTVSGAGGTMNISGEGAVAFANGSALTVSNINVTDGTLDVTEMNGGSGLTLASGQTLNNDSNTSVNGDVTAASGSTISGRGTFDNNLTVQSGGTLQIGKAAFDVAGNVVSWNVDNFGTIGGDGSGSLPALTAEAGVVNTGGWTNDFPAYDNTDLRDDLGLETSTDIAPFSNSGTYNINGFAHAGQDTDGSWNKELLTGYLNSGAANGAGGAGVVITEIPYSSYDIIAYFGADVDTRTGTVSDGTTTYDFNVLDGMIAGANATFTQTASTGGSQPEANYAIFTGLSGDTQTITVDIPDFGGLAGFQIVNNGASGPAVETMTVLGDVSLAAGSTVSFNIGDSGINDLLNITGNLGVADGFVLEVQLDGLAAAPGLGDSWDLFDFDTASGTFDEADFILPTLAGGLFWDTTDLLVTGQISVTDTGGFDPADLNMDGFVDGLDLGILLGSWNQTVAPSMGELNGIPPVDGLDLGILLGAWNPAPALASSAAVPEPGTLALLGLCLMGGLVTRRRK